MIILRRNGIVTIVYQGPGIGWSWRAQPKRGSESRGTAWSQADARARGLAAIDETEDVRWRL